MPTIPCWWVEGDIDVFIHWCYCYYYYCYYYDDSIDNIDVIVNYCCWHCCCGKWLMNAVLHYLLQWRSNETMMKLLVLWRYDQCDLLVLIVWGKYCGNWWYSMILLFTVDTLLLYFLVYDVKRWYCDDVIVIIDATWCFLDTLLSNCIWLLTTDWHLLLIYYWRYWWC